MGHWNYRMCREQVEEIAGSGETVPLYTLREVHYDDEGEPRGWGAEPATFAGDTPGELIEALILAGQSWPARGVLDLDTRQTVRVRYNGTQSPD